MKRVIKGFGAGVLLALLVSGCDFDEASKDAPEQKHKNKKSAVSWTDEGAFLSAFVQVDPLGCDGDFPRIALSGELLTTGKAGSIELIVSADGAEAESIVLVEKKSFEKVDGVMQAPIDVQVLVPVAEHSLRLCMYRRSSQGHSERGACLPEMDVPLTCERREVAEDETPPRISATPDREPNENGWYDGPVRISYVCEDEDSGIQSCPEEQLLEGEGRDESAWGATVDAAGNYAGTVFRARIDTTPPEITFVGAREYLVDEAIEVGCSIGDPLSGVAESSCLASAGSAFLFELGEHSITASARDLAGNLSEASAEFSVKVDASSLCNLVTRFVEHEGVARSLCSRLFRVEAALERGEESLVESELSELHETVEEEEGDSVPDEFADTLRRLADGFHEHHLER